MQDDDTNINAQECDRFAAKLQKPLKFPRYAADNYFDHRAYERLHEAVHEASGFLEPADLARLHAEVRARAERARRVGEAA